MVAIFLNLCFVYGDVVYVQGIDPEKLYRANLTFCCVILFIKASAESASPSNSFLKTVDEVEKSVYESQALESFYVQSPARLKKIEKIIKLAANQSNDQSFIRQSLGHALYTAREIEKKKPRKKRCSVCRDAMKKFMKMIETEIGKENFQKFVGTKNSARTTLMFAIDDTGSMSDEIQAAKDIATYIVNISRPNLEVDYILSPFNDPGMEAVC